MYAPSPRNVAPNREENAKDRSKGTGSRLETPSVLAAISYDPLVHIDLGPLQISPHGVGIAVGFLLGARLMLPEARRKGFTDFNF